MISLQDLCRWLEELYNSGMYRDYCPNGLQVEGREEVRKLATAVSANMETLEAAKERGVDALIVHHGLFWKGDDLTLKGTMKKKVQLLMDQGISLFGYHLPMDAHIHIGNNHFAANALGLSQLEPFGETNGFSIGVKGVIEPTSQAEFQKRLEEYYGHPATTAEGGPEKVQSVAIASGGGWKFLSEASRKGVDALVTGNFDEPAWSIAHEEGVHFFAMGHSATERVGPMALAKWIEEELKLPCEFIDCYNPF